MLTSASEICMRLHMYVYKVIKKKRCACVLGLCVGSSLGSGIWICFSRHGFKLIWSVGESPVLLNPVRLKPKQTKKAQF